MITSLSFIALNQFETCRIIFPQDCDHNTGFMFQDWITLANL
jgi:hypothetical protein